MIEAEGLTKDYGTIVAVADVSFRIERGEVVGFLGPNGAGKSTTLRMITGFLGPTRGTVRVNGYSVQERPLEARRALGYMPEGAPLYPELRVAEYLNFRAELKGVPSRERRTAVGRSLELTQITDVADTLILHLSRGYRQRVALADALVAKPPLLVLDEPTAGLDPNQIREVRRLVRELGREHTLLVSSHILSEVESTCDRALVIHRGRLVAEGSLDELRARRSPGVRVVARGEAELARVRSASVPGVRSVRAHPDPEEGYVRLEIEIDPEARRAVEEIVAVLVVAGLSVREVVPRRASLEEVFAQLTGAELERTALRDPARESA
jgi:ABC-2 type transport system ATP-binding protein